MQKFLDYLVLVLLISLFIFLSSCEKEDILSPITEEIVEEVVEVSIEGVEFLEVPDYLSTPAENSEKIIPVVVINWIPSNDGITVTDKVAEACVDWGNVVHYDLTVETLNKWILSNDNKVKFSIEEGSKFRGSVSNTNPYIGIQVIKYINVYDMPTIVPNDGIQNTNTILPNYKELFLKLGMEDLVNNHGVKEVWINWTNTGDTWIPESNMSSPITGDVSNSYHREDDLPVYDKTYVVYGSVYDRWYAEMTHSRGHQYEAQLAYLDNNFFWQKFVGFPEGEPQPYNQGGKCGSTHYTPNSVADYDYDNSDVVMSNILDWDPDQGEGSTIEVNNLTWKYPRTAPYTTPNITSHERFKVHAESPVGSDGQGGWLIYWFQSIPSKNNGIMYGEKEITNWWDIIFEWDETITNNTNLYK